MRETLRSIAWGALAFGAGFGLSNMIGRLLSFLGLLPCPSESLTGWGFLALVVLAMTAALFWVIGQVVIAELEKKEAPDAR